jgi:hypothetical protein
MNANMESATYRFVFFKSLLSHIEQTRMKLSKEGMHDSLRGNIPADASVGVHGVLVEAGSFSLPAGAAEAKGAFRAGWLAGKTRRHPQIGRRAI